MRIRDLMTAPPGGWKYKQPETDFWMLGTTFHELVGKVAKHRENNKLRIVREGFENISTDIEDAICSTMRSDCVDRICETPNRVTGPQPGRVFSVVIHKITGRSALTCGLCGTRMSTMNGWGWWGCWTRREEILGWLVQEAGNRGHKVSRSDVWTLFRAAYKEINAHRKSLRK